MSYKPKFLGHINIFVRNAERSQQWYSDVLGLHTYDLRPDAAFMAADIEQSHEIALIQVGDDAPGPEKGRVGLNHMAWMMESLDDLKELYLRIKEKNIPIARVSDHGVSIGVYFHDPDGNGIEVGYELPRSEWHRQDKLFTDIPTGKGLFPGPWDEELAKQAAPAR
ncbi:MAG: VOC family protein [Chloroflexi bacterium]|nr:VOC family protein [Chloroflexota bacterium]